MPRPSGKAQEIAEKTVPGLTRNRDASFPSKKKGVPNDAVEIKIVDINENRGKVR